MGILEFQKKDDIVNERVGEINKNLFFNHKLKFNIS